MKILKLPYLVQNEILKEMDAGDLFVFFFLSARTKRLVANALLNNSHTVVDCSQFRTTTRIRCPRDRSYEKIINFSVQREIIDGESLTFLNINDSLFNMANIAPDGRSLADKFLKERQTTFGKVCISLLVTIFGPISSLDLSLSVLREYDASGMQHIISTSNYSNFMSSNETIHLCFDYHFREIERTFPASNGMMPQHVMLANSSRMFLSNATWFTGNMLLQYSGKEAVFHNTILTDVDISVFVQNWFESTGTKIKSLILWQNESNPLDAAQILEDVPHNGWDSNTRSRVYFGSPKLMQFFTAGESLLDCEDGFDLIRETDGLMATVRVLHARVFCFYVWYQRFPE